MELTLALVGVRPRTNAPVLRLVAVALAGCKEADESRKSSPLGAAPLTAKRVAIMSRPSGAAMPLDPLARLSPGNYYGAPGNYSTGIIRPAQATYYYVSLALRGGTQYDVRLRFGRHLPTTDLG